MKYLAMNGGCAYCHRLDQANLTAIAIMPSVGEQVTHAQRGAGSEKEQGSAWAIRNVVLVQRFLHRSHALVVRSYRQHAKGFPTELLLVLTGGVRGKIC